VEWQKLHFTASGSAGYASRENTLPKSYYQAKKILYPMGMCQLLASVPIVVVGFTFIKEFVSIGTWVYLIHSDKGV